MPRFSSRTLDIDIVLYGDAVLRGPGNLRIPRDELKHAFVLQPMADIAGDVVHPVSKRTIGELWKAPVRTAMPGERVDTLDQYSERPPSTFRISPVVNVASRIRNKHGLRDFLRRAGSFERRARDEVVRIASGRCPATGSRPARRH